MESNLTALQDLLLGLARANRQRPLGDGCPIDLRIDDFLSKVVFVTSTGDTDSGEGPTATGNRDARAASLRAAVIKAITDMSPQFVEIVYGPRADHENGVDILGFRLTHARESREPLRWADAHQGAADLHEMLSRHQEAADLREMLSRQMRSTGEHSQDNEMVVSGLAMLTAGILGTLGSYYLAENFGARFMVVAGGLIFSGLVCLFKGLPIQGADGSSDITPVPSTQLPSHPHHADATDDRDRKAASPPSLIWPLFVVAVCMTAWGVSLSCALAAAYYFLRYGERFPLEAVGFTVAALLAFLVALLTMSAGGIDDAYSMAEKHPSPGRFKVACIAVFLVTVIEVLISIPMAYRVAGGNHPGRVILAWLVVTTLLVGVGVYANWRVLRPRGTGQE